MLKKTTIYTLILIICVSIGIIWYKEIWYWTQYNDCNLILNADSIPASLWLLKKEDIVKAHVNMCSNCPLNWWDSECRWIWNEKNTAKNDGKTNTSQYMFDHLVEIIVSKLQGKAEKEFPWLESDPSGVELKKLWEEIISWANNKDIKTIPSEFLSKYNIIMDKTGSAIAQNGFYTGSTWLQQKYHRLCDIARWAYLNPKLSNIATKKWTTSYELDSRYNICVWTYVPNILDQVVTKQQALAITNFTTVMQKIQESVNQYSFTELNTVLETTQTFTNQMTDVTKKIDQKMENCNPTDK